LILKIELLHQNTAYLYGLIHEYVREFVRKRVRDGVINRMVGKWLKAGIMEDGQLHYPRQGTPQGGVMTPRTQKVTCNF
jgi:retron-type reverse transcriptase